jgi:hypothetical protein
MYQLACSVFLVPTVLSWELHHARNAQLERTLCRLDSYCAIYAELELMVCKQVQSRRQIVVVVLLERTPRLDLRFACAVPLGQNLKMVMLFVRIVSVVFGRNMVNASSARASRTVCAREVLQYSIVRPFVYSLVEMMLLITLA